MPYQLIHRKTLAAAAAVALLLADGCQWSQPYQRPAAPLGTISDSVWQRQEANAERCDFVVYEHEFQMETEILNTAGEDHVKQIAMRLASGQDAQVLVERSQSSARAETAYQFRVHPNPELDMRRREIVVRSLTAMGIPDADLRVVVAPSPVPTYKAGEAAASYGEAGDSGFGGLGGFGGFFFGAGRY